VEYAVWDLLHRAGYRHFSGKVWEIMPSVPTLQVDVDALKKPDYHDHRSSTPGSGPEVYESMMRNRVSLHCLWDTRDIRPETPGKWKNNFIEASHAYSLSSVTTQKSK
jgi:hypothetical protein